MESPRLPPGHQEDRIQTAAELREMPRLLLPTGRVVATMSSPYGDR